MPFKTYAELINMTEDDPKMAQMYIAKAKQSGRPVVSPSNPGYKKNAIKRRMGRLNKIKTPTQEEEIVNKRKQVGY